MVKNLSLSQFATESFDIWIEELIPKGRAFPNMKDGLKESTRAIVTALAVLSNFSTEPQDTQKLLGKVTDYKESRSSNIEKNLFRLASSNTPLLRVISVDEQDFLNGLDRIGGGNSAPKYVNIALTELGKYVFKYEKYFKKVRSEANSGTEKYQEILTPLPLSLLIPQVNLSDGFSNKAPNINILQLIDAYIAHLKKNKNTTTEELAQHIKGFESTPGSKVLMSNQSLHDFIEKGVAKAVILAPIKFYEGEMLIQELPYKKFGQQIMNEFNELNEKGLKNQPEGFQTFVVHGITPEQSDESFITIKYSIKNGYTIKDVKHEIYNKTSMKERIVYENLCLDLDSDKPLTIKSVREILDYHVDLGIDLKSRGLKSELAILEEERDEAEFLELITRKICIDIIGAIIGEADRNKLVDKYLQNAHEIMESYAKGSLTDSDLSANYPHIDDVIRRNLKRLKELSVAKLGDDSIDNLMKAIDHEVPKSFPAKYIPKIFQKQYEVLYDLNKRKKAIKTLNSFKEKHKIILEKLSPEGLISELENELLELRRKYEGSTFSENLFALKEQERQERLKLKRDLVKSIKKMYEDLPVNVLIDKDYNAILSINPADRMENLHQVIECTTNDTLIVINKEGKSKKVPVDTLAINKLTQLSEPSEDVICVLVDEHRTKIKPLYVFATNLGRAIICNRDSMLFRHSKLNIPLMGNETIIYSEIIPDIWYNENYALLLKTSDNVIKKRKISDFVIKNRLNEFFTLFTDVSLTDKVSEGAVVSSNNRVLNIWKDKLYRIPYIKGFKRNVSKGETLDTDLVGGCIINDKIPTLDGKIITDLNSLSGSNYFRKLSNIIFEHDNNKLNERFKETDISEIKFVKIITSFTRIGKKLDFEVDEHQLQTYIDRLLK